MAACVVSSLSLIGLPVDSMNLRNDLGSFFISSRMRRAVYSSLVIIVPRKGEWRVVKHNTCAVLGVPMYFHGIFKAIPHGD